MWTKLGIIRQGDNRAITCAFVLIGDNLKQTELDKQKCNKTDSSSTFVVYFTYMIACS